MSVNRILIKDGCVITLDSDVGDHPRADVLIEGSSIVAIGPNLGADDAVQIDARQCIVIPGMVDAHRHTWHTTMRNLNSDLTFIEYFSGLLPQISVLQGPEDMYAGTLLGSLEALDAGITTLVEFGLMNTPEHADSTIDAMHEARIRGVFAHGCPTDDVARWWHDSTEQHPRDAERLRSERFSSDDQLLTFAIAARGPERTHADINRADIQFARSLDARIAMHIDETGSITKMRDDLGSDMIYTHCCRCDAQDLALIKASGGHVNVTPECEMGLREEPVTAKLLALGMRPSIGQDGAGTVSGDLIFQMRLAIQQARMKLLKEALDRNEPLMHSPVSSRDALEWGTIEGARQFGLDHMIGTLTPGKRADIVIMRADGLHMTPVNNPIAAVVQTASPRDVDTVIVDGEIRKRHGRLVDVDIDRVRRLAIESRDRTFEAIGVPEPAGLMPPSPVSQGWLG